MPVKTLNRKKIQQVPHWSVWWMFDGCFLPVRLETMGFLLKTNFLFILWTQARKWQRYVKVFHLHVYMCVYSNTFVSSYISINQCIVYSIFIYWFPFICRSSENTEALWHQKTGTVADRFLNKPVSGLVLPQDFTIKLLQKGAREYQQGHGRKKLEIWPWTELVWCADVACCTKCTGRGLMLHQKPYFGRIHLSNLLLKQAWMRDERQGTNQQTPASWRVTSFKSGRFTRCLVHWHYFHGADTFAESFNGHFVD